MVYFFEGEVEDGSDEDEGEVGCGFFGNVFEENVVILGFLDKIVVGFVLMEFCVVLDFYVFDVGCFIK